MNDLLDSPSMTLPRFVSSRNSKRTFSRCSILAAVLCLTLFGIQNHTYAIGGDYKLNGSDLLVDVSSKWVGGHDGGYFPVRLRIRNIGPARELTLQFSDSRGSRNVPTVRQTVQIDQNQTLSTSLLIPVVSVDTWGRVQILEDGRPLKGLEQTVSLPDMVDHFSRGASMLVIADHIVDGDMYDRAVDSLVRESTSHSGYHHSGGDYHEVIDPSLLPETWVAYSGVDMIAIPKSVLISRMNNEARQAILDWVETGGTLMIYDLESFIGEDKELLKTIKFDNKAQKTDWKQAATSSFRHMNVIDPTDPSKSSPETLSDGKPWKVNKDRFAIADYGLGQIVGFQESPFPGTGSHWAWVLRNCDGFDRLLWINRSGFSPRVGTGNFLKFLIPGVGRVPATAFLILITLFTIVIGPVNYAYCLKKKRLSLLLVTVPLLALGSSILLIGYSTIAHGFSIKSRIRSVTYLDQKMGASTTISRVAYYAGATPSAGLVFEPTTAVYPIYHSSGAFSAGTVDWSDQQHFTGGWLRSRTRTQFLTVSHREQRGRVTVTFAGGSGELSNGLEWDINQIVVLDDDGKAWVGNKIQAGAVGALSPITPEFGSQIRETLAEYELELPEGVTQEQVAQVISHGRVHRGYYHESIDVYQKSIQEKTLNAIRLSDGYLKVLQPNSYFALLNEQPDLDIGINSVRTRSSLNAVVGYY